MVGKIMCPSFSALMECRNRKDCEKFHSSNLLRFSSRPSKNLASLEWAWKKTTQKPRKRDYTEAYANLFNKPCTCLPASNAKVLVVWNVESFTWLIVVQQVEHRHSRLHIAHVLCNNIYWTSNTATQSLLLQSYLWCNLCMDGAATAR